MTIARGIDAQRACTEIDDLQQAANDYEVLEEMDQLVLIGEVSMKEDGRCQRKRGNDHRCQAGTEPD
jgi:hypothetical protein